MSDYDEIRASLAEIQEQTTWLVKAVKTLLTAQTGWVSETTTGQYVNDEPEPEPVVSAPVEVQDVCYHQHQTRQGNSILCAKCGFVLVAGAGVVGQDPGATIARKREVQ